MPSTYKPTSPTPPPITSTPPPMPSTYKPTSPTPPPIPSYQNSPPMPSYQNSTPPPMPSTYQNSPPPNYNQVPTSMYSNANPTPSIIINSQQQPPPFFINAQPQQPSPFFINTQPQPRPTFIINSNLPYNQSSPQFISGTLPLFLSNYPDKLINHINFLLTNLDLSRININLNTCNNINKNKYINNQDYLYFVNNCLENLLLNIDKINLINPNFRNNDIRLENTKQIINFIHSNFNNENFKIMYTKNINLIIKLLNTELNNSNIIKNILFNYINILTKDELIFILNIFKLFIIILKNETNIYNIYPEYYNLFNLLYNNNKIYIDNIINKYFEKEKLNIMIFGTNFIDDILNKLNNDLNDQFYNKIKESPEILNIFTNNLFLKGGNLHNIAQI
jgi:hypothetical protein